MRDVIYAKKMKKVQIELFFIVKTMIICYKSNMKKKTKRIIVSITAALMMFVYYNYDYTYVPQYEIVGTNYSSKKPYAKYRYGDVYIVKSEKQINKDSNNPYDVFVIDQRKNADPNIKIISSCEINDKDARNDILEILMQYEKDHPSKWDRTIESLRIEWFVHNILHFFNYKTDHTTDVDLNNNDEEKFKNDFYGKILKI